MEGVVLNGGPRCRRLQGHEIPYRSGDSVGGKHGLHRLVDVAGIGANERACFPGCAVLVPERSLAGRRPHREVGHARNPLQLDLRPPRQSHRHGIEQRAQDAWPVGLERGQQFLFGPALVLRDRLQRQEDGTIRQVGRSPLLRCR